MSYVINPLSGRKKGGPTYVFEKIDKGKVNYFKILWQSDRLDESDRAQIWKWYDYYFIIISEKYQKAVV